LDEVAKKEATMQSQKWVHIPFHRGQVILSEKANSSPLKFNQDSTLSAWVLVVSNDDFLLNGRVCGLAFVEESSDHGTLRIHLGWLEHAPETRGQRGRIVAALTAFAWGRWIDARLLFLVGRKGDGVALTREITDNGEWHVLRWAHGRLRTISREAASSIDVRRDEAGETITPRVKAPYRQSVGTLERIQAFA